MEFCAWTRVTREVVGDSREGAKSGRGLRPELKTSDLSKMCSS